MITRKNILSIVDAAKASYHSAVLTSFSFDPIFFCEYYLPRLRNRGIVNVVVFVDCGRYDELMSDVATYAQYLNGYTLIRQQPSNRGVFHPKICICVGNESGLAAVGSGNLTYSGVSLNDEIWGVVRYVSTDTKTAPLFKSVWNYLKRLSKSHISRTQMRWIEDNAVWLREILEDNNLPSTAFADNGDEITFATNGAGQTIIETVREMIQSDSDVQATIVSPFYDRDLTPLRSLCDDLKIVVNYQNGTVPQQGVDGTGIFKWHSQENQIESNLHAKIFQIITDKNAYLLFGSSNATSKGLGLNNATFNDEACWIIKSGPQRNFLKDIGIDNCISPLSIEEMNAMPAIEESIKENTECQLIKILSASVSGRTVSLSTNIALADGDFDIKFFTHSSSIPNETVLPFAYEVRLPAGFEAKSIVIMKDGAIISNHFWLHNDEVIVKQHPNRQNSNLIKYLKQNQLWYDGISKILQFITFEDNKPQPRIASTVKNDESQGDETINTAEFDQSSLTIKRHFSQNPNMMIAQWIMGLFEKGQRRSNQNNETSEESEIEQPDFSQDIERELEKIWNTEKHLSYFVNRVNDHLDKALKRIKTGKFYSVKRQATDNDYARLIIALQLIAFEHNSNPITSKIRFQQVLRLLSKSTFLYYHGPLYDDEYRIEKLNALMKMIVSAALTLFSFYPWVRSLKNEMEVVLLNVFNWQYNNGLDITDETFADVMQAAAANEIPINEASFKLVKDTFNLYKTFISKDKRDRRSPIAKVIPGSIIFVKEIGFAFLESKRLNDMGWYEYTYIVPWLDIKVDSHVVKEWIEGLF